MHFRLQNVTRSLALGLCVLTMQACLFTGGKPSFLKDKANGDGNVMRGVSFYEETLRRFAEAEFKDRERDQREGRTKIIRRKPFFYKEYVAYPQGPDAFSVSVQERDSRTVPYTAELRIPMQRFSTELTKKKSKAEADADFVRETGTETVSYELRAGKWRRTASLFIASTQEVNDDGVWRAATPEDTTSF